VRSGERVRSRTLDVKRLASTHGYVRVAIVVPKLGCTAVRRNKIKRRLRELARQHLLVVDVSWDVLLRARREAYDASFEDLRDEVTRVSQQLA